MTWFGWLLIAFWGLSYVLVIGDVGKPRKPMTSGVAAAIFVVYAVLAAVVLTVGTGTGL